MALESALDVPHGQAGRFSPSQRRELAMVGLVLTCIAAHLLLRFIPGFTGIPPTAPLLAALLLGGFPLVWELLLKAVRREFGADFLAGISIVTSVLLGEYLAGAIVVLMLAGGNALEQFAVRRASGVLEALARRMPTRAHRRRDGADLEEIPVESIAPGDEIVIFPHETCPVDGVVIEGHGRMNEAYLTGEPFEISKTPGCEVISGAVNGDSALVIRASKRASDSRYARIMEVMKASVQRRPKFRRLGDKLGGFYTPLALAIAIGSWLVSGEPGRFLAVLVVATPCPLLIAIPVAIIGSISLAAKRGIIIRDPASLELVDTCRTIILDKTGTLTRGIPILTDITLGADIERKEVLTLAASVERYSKHPLARAVLEAARNEQLLLRDATEVREPPGEGLRAKVGRRDVEITGRRRLQESALDIDLPPTDSGLECVVLVDGKFAALFRFHDEPSRGTLPFVRHLSEKHGFDRIMIVSGDRETEVRHVAALVGIENIHAEMSPEEKVTITQVEVHRAPTLFIGDGINDAPALAAATVGIAFGMRSDVTAEAAGAVVMDNSLLTVDELFHIGRRMRRIALQSAVGGMLLSVIAMIFAAAGTLPPVAGALVQEGIDLVAVLHALRASLLPEQLSDVGLPAPPLDGKAAAAPH